MGYVEEKEAKGEETAEVDANMWVPELVESDISIEAQLMEWENRIQKTITWLIDRGELEAVRPGKGSHEERVLGRCD